MIRIFPHVPNKLSSSNQVDRGKHSLARLRKYLSVLLAIFFVTTSLPATAATTVTITVHGGGLRTSATAVAGIPSGTVFTATPLTGNPSGGPFTCTTAGTSGECGIAVPSGHSWSIEMTTAPSGYYLNPTLAYGSSSTVTSETYAFETGKVNSNTDVPGSNPNGTYEDSRHPSSNYFSGLFAGSLDNPAVSQKCGLNVALVLDQSGSMAGSKQTTLKAAANGTIDALTGTPSQLAIYTFASSTGSHIASTSTATTTSAAPLKTFINGLATPSGSTNWDVGLNQVPSGFDLVIFLTDGAPTIYDTGAGSGSRSYFQYVEQGIFSANRVKSTGTRIVAIGVGLDGGADNLRAVSGPTIDSDYYAASESGFGDILKSLATGACANELTIQKQILGPDGVLIENSELANDWNFATSLSGSGTINPSVTTGLVNGLNGFGSATVSIPTGTNPTVTITESLKSGYTFDSAQCKVDGNNVTTNVSGTTITFVAAANVPLACLITNKAKTDNWHLVKTSDPVSGSTVSAGQTVTYTLTAINDTAFSMSGKTATDDLSDVLDDATLGALPSGVTNNSGVLTWAIPNIPANSSVSVSYSVTISAQAFNAHLHNVATPGTGGTCVQSSDCETTHETEALAHLTLIKNVDNSGTGGTKTSTDWTLSAYGGVDGTTILDSASGVRHIVKPGSYSLSESLQQTGYTTNGVWECIGQDPVSGKPSVAQVVIAKGDDVLCTVTNKAQPSTWTVSKTSDPADGTTVNPGSTITYRVTLNHTGGVMPSNTVVSDDLSAVLNHASFTGSSASSGSATLTGSTLTWNTGSFSGSATLTYTVVVESNAYGVELVNTVTPPTGGSCVASCSTIHFTGHYIITKSANPADHSVVQRGQTIVYTLHAHNDSMGVVSGANVTDDLTNVLNNAYLVTPLATGLSLQSSGTSLIWAIPTLGPHEDAYVSYAVVVNQDAYNATLRNHITPSSSGDCPSESSCSTSHQTPRLGHLTLIKNVDNGSTGGVLLPSNWTLSADGGPTGTQISNSATGIRHEVLTGTYALSESAQALGYFSDGTWHCVGASGAMPSANTVTIAQDEDVVCTIVNTALPSAWRIEKSSDPMNGSTVLPGQSITYTLTLTHVSGVMPADTVVTDDLSDLLNHSAFGSLSSSTGSATLVGSTLTWHTGSFLGVATLTYSVNVDADAFGVSLVNVVTPPTGGSCVESCSTTHPTPHYSVTKSAVPASGSIVQRGQTVFYTLHATNDSAGVVTNVSITDNLADVLDDASLVTPLSPGLSLNPSGTTLYWFISSLAPGQSTSVTYAVVVKEDAFNATLHNSVTPSESGDCSTPADCNTTHTTPALAHLTLVKVVDNGTTGGTKTVNDWTLSAQSDGASQIVESTSDVRHEILAGDYNLSESAQQLGYTSDGVWHCSGQSEAGMLHQDTIRIAKGEDVTCSITNVAQPSRWSISKASNPASGSTVLPNTTLTYTVVLTHTGGVMPANTVVADDVTDLLSHASLNSISVTNGSAEIVGNTLTWNTGAFVNSASMTYSFTINADANGVTLRNVVTPPPGGSCTETCTTVNYTPHYTVAKTSNPISGSTVEPGSSITYTLHANNDSLGVVQGAVVSDNLANVLNHASLKVPLSPGLTLAPDGTTLNWLVPNLSPGASAEISYQVTVDAGAYASELHNVVIPSGAGECESSQACSSTHTTPQYANLTLVKVVNNGQTGGIYSSADWTLSADGGTSGSHVTNSLSGVVHQIFPGTYNLSESEQQLGYSTDGVWLCDGLGESGHMVDADTVVVAPGQNVTCTITNTAQSSAWRVNKSSNPTTGSTVTPGSTVTYTLSLEHVSGVIPAHTVVTDDLFAVLSHATFISAVASSGNATLVGNTLTWTTGAVSTSATLTYTVTINSDAFGVSLVNVVAPPPGGVCDVTCSSTIYTPHYVVAKAVDPQTGSAVQFGDTVTYTLYARNDSFATLSGATASDDLSDVLDDATLVTPLPTDLSFDELNKRLSWNIPQLAPGEQTSISYSVTVTSIKSGQSLKNVLKPDAGGDCNSVALDKADSSIQDLSCETQNPVKIVDMLITKVHTVPIEQAAVDGSVATPITYELTVTNAGTVQELDDAAGVVVTDPMISKLVLQLDSIDAPDWDVSTSTSDSFVARYTANGGIFPAGQSSIIHFTGQIVPPLANGEIPVPGLENTACVSTTSYDIDEGNNCSVDSTNVKWVAIDPLGACRNGTPLMDYAIPLFDSLPGEEQPTIALVWWEVGTYTEQDRTIDVSDTAAMLAAGALRVDYIRTPSDWSPGDIVKGTVLWPGAVINTAGDPIDWPGLTQQADGSWIVDPRAPFYEIRNRAVVEVRITNSTTSTYVPVSGISTCHPSTSNFLEPLPDVLPHTGFDPSILVRGFLLIIGVAFVSGLAGRRRR